MKTILLTKRLIMTQKSGDKIITQISKIWLKYKDKYQIDLNNLYIFNGTDKKNIYTYKIKFDTSGICGFSLINNN